MARTAYQRGRANEYKAMEKLRKMGWLVLRSAGSHSPLDLFAAKDGERLLIQVKSGSGRASGDELTELILWAKAFRGTAEVWHFKGRDGVQKEVVYEKSAKQRA